MAMAMATALPYSSTINTGMDEMAMSHQLGLRTLGLLAIVALATAVLVKPELVGAPRAATAPAFAAMLAVGHN
jgi:hypothetical protein